MQSSLVTGGRLTVLATRAVAKTAQLPSSPYIPAAAAIGEAAFAGSTVPIRRVHYISPSSCRRRHAPGASLAALLPAKPEGLACSRTDEVFPGHLFIGGPCRQQQAARSSSSRLAAAAAAGSAPAMAAAGSKGKALISVSDKTGLADLAKVCL